MLVLCISDINSRQLADLPYIFPNKLDSNCSYSSCRVTVAVRWCCSDPTGATSWPEPFPTASSVRRRICRVSICAPPSTSRGCAA